MKTWSGDLPHIPADSESSRVTFPETVYAVGCLLDWASEWGYGNRIHSVIWLRDIIQSGNDWLVSQNEKKN